MSNDSVAIAAEESLKYGVEADACLTKTYQSTFLLPDVAKAR
jgi:hypothetical protein